MYVCLLLCCETDDYEKFFWSVFLLWWECGVEVEEFEGRGLKRWGKGGDEGRVGGRGIVKCDKEKEIINSDVDTKDGHRKYDASVFKKLTVLKRKSLASFWSVFECKRNKLEVFSIFDLILFSKNAFNLKKQRFSIQ